MELAFNLTFYAFFLAFFAAMLALVWTNRVVRFLQEALIGVAFAACTTFLALRWIEAGHPPFSNLFESLVCFALCLGATYAFIRLATGLWQLAAPVTLMALGLIGYAWLIDDRTIQPLLPALQHNFWLTTHVLLCFIGYAGFAVALVLSLFFLGGHRQEIDKADVPHAALALGFGVLCLLATALVAWWKLPRAGTMPVRMAWASIPTLLVLGAIGLALVRARLTTFCRDGREKLERGCYLSVAFGFPFLGAGILSGSVWANVAWGSYWSWDPKETASLVTWLVFAVFLHLRVVSGRRSTALFWIPVLGFVCVLFTYFGVNFLDSLHSYGAGGPR